MRNLTSKLRQSRGASIIIAMVFMLICVFVGGSVLTAATANASRVRHLAGTQEFLNQKSAAMLLCDELRVPGEAQLKLIVRETDKKEVRFSPSTKKADMTPMQQIVYEAAIQRYLQKYNLYSADITIDSNLPKTDRTKFWVKAPVSGEGTDPIKIKGPAVAGESSLISADFACDDDYNFSVTLGDPSFMNVSMEAYIAESEVEVQVPKEDGKGFVTQKTKVTAVCWIDPVIEKGDAQ